MKVVFQIIELVSQPKKEEAKILLERLATATESIMKRRDWKVKKLKEFYPDNPSLLGLNENKGNTIKIRLRDPKNINVFLPWESLLGTMIHELAHNEISDHSAQFYKLLDTLYDEVTSGFSANSSQVFFEGKSCKLGGKSQNKANLKDLIANSALRRQFSSNYCHVLGGQTSSDSLKVSIASATQKRVSDLLINDSKLISSAKNMSENLWKCAQCLDQNISIVKTCTFCGFLRSDKILKRRNVLCLECNDFNRMYCNICSLNVGDSSFTNYSVNKEKFKRRRGELKSNTVVYDLCKI
jgi:hypothetical protein